MIIQVLPEPIVDFLTVLEYWDHILSGSLLTLWLYGWAILIGFFLGLALAIFCSFYRNCAWHTFNRTIIAYIFSPF